MEETPDRTGNSGMSELKVVFFFPLLPEEDIIKVVVDVFLFKRGGEAGKKGFQPMRKKVGEKFGVVFSFAVVVTNMELNFSSFISYDNVPNHPLSPYPHLCIKHKQGRATTTALKRIFENNSTTR